MVIGGIFSSEAAGKIAEGTLEIRDSSIISTNSIGMKFPLIPAVSFVMRSSDESVVRKQVAAW